MARGDGSLASYLHVDGTYQPQTPELVYAMVVWAVQNGVELGFIDPGRPIQNGHVESFNGRFREECLDRERFVTPREARDKIEAWRRNHNEDQTHCSLGYMTPIEWANN